MPTLTIKGLPREVYLRLKRQAAAHRRSLNGEIIVCLERALGAGPPDPEAWLRRADAFRRRLALDPMTLEEMEAAKRAGRP